MVAELFHADTRIERRDEVGSCLLLFYEQASNITTLLTLT